MAGLQVGLVHNTPPIPVLMLCFNVRADTGAAGADSLLATRDILSGEHGGYCSQFCYVIN